MISGLHVCKPTNVPQVGQVKTFAVSGDRIKSKKAEEGGQSYTIIKVTKSETYKDNYGNLGFNLEIEPTDGAPTQQSHATGRTGTGNGHSDDRSNRIERQHSQEMALRYMALRFPTGIPDNIDGAAIIRDMTSWFQRDIGRSPEKQQQEPPQALIEDNESDEPPF